MSRGCLGCEERSRLEEHLPDEAKRRGAHVTFVPADEFDAAAEAARLDDVGNRRPSP